MNTKLLLLGLLLAAPALQAKTPTARQAQRWLDKGAWAHGWAVRPDASVNAVEFATQYAAHPALWDSLFTYLATTNLDALPLGRVDLVPGRLWVTVSEYVPRRAEDIRIEGHQRFIDLQYTLRGSEYMGLAVEAEVKEPYNAKRDVGFWSPVRMNYYPTSPDRFFLFFPSDKHQPSVRATSDDTTPSRKIVAKIAYE